MYLPPSLICIHMCVCVCNMTHEIGPLLKQLKKQFCIHTVAIYTQLFRVTPSIQNCF